VIGARNNDAGSKFLSGGADALILGRDDDLGEIASLRGALPDVLQHGFSGDGGENFAGES
jgi:hypothetical protein